MGVRTRLSRLVLLRWRGVTLQLPTRRLTFPDTKVFFNPMEHHGLSDPSSLVTSRTPSLARRRPFSTLVRPSEVGRLTGRFVGSGTLYDKGQDGVRTPFSTP